MTEFPRKGDRVRVVYEGVVVSSIETLGDVRVFTDTGHTILTGQSAKSIEVLERPVTFRPETLVVGAGDEVDDWAPLVRLTNGKWLNAQSGTPTKVTDAYVAKQIRSGVREVAYEPPA